jgi:predicted dehydrogenase
MNRRNFITNTSAAALASPLILLGSNKKYKTALVGCGWWGTNIARVAIQSGQCDLVAMCDVDESQLKNSSSELEKLTGKKPTFYKDYRELLHKEKPQIVIIGTPDHWHALPAIAAMEAGADVYLEKPIGHTIAEGTAMVKKARETQRVVQVGTHRRGSPHNISAMQFLREGKLGQVGMVRAFVHYGGGKGKPTPDAEPPAGLDWDFWLGPAPYRPYNPKIHPKGFRKFLDFANGTLGDWGIHWLDQILWWTDELYPKSVHSTAARHIVQDSTDAPDTQVVNYEFETFSAVWEHRTYGGNSAEKHNIGCYFYGTKGMLHLGWLDGWTFYPSKKSGQSIHVGPQLNDPDKQNISELWTNFLHCLKTRERPICDIEIAHRSTNMSLLGMLSFKAGRSILWDGEKEKIINDAEANKLLRREYRTPWKYPII